ncbi:hypothetical protein RvY_01530-1 [Ramazzottius varieornatus]|uniref:Uncharacterized protein n=1 Tax=Ramazzottius varieornatus TaxID=947166 RepID=A0A1D1UGZ3_RAMVA|nr:hypothetical protein RvY_01530-1 [Ramazzottius varieornatus]
MDGWATRTAIHTFVRGDVSNQLHNLLLNEHLQWNPEVFYQFLTSISDPNPEIREWVRSCLRSLMKKRNQCFSDFSEAIIFLNACHSHPRFKVAAKLDNQGVEFALVGRECADNRMEIYSLMFKQMVDDQKRITYARILEQILMPVVTRDVQIEANEAYRNVLRDVFRILGLKEMQFSVFIKNTDEEEELEEPEENADADQVEEENQRKAEKQNKAQRKELWIKFRQEIVRRTLLPVSSSVYRQVKYV